MADRAKFLEHGEIQAKPSCREGGPVVLEPRRLAWSEQFLRLAGSAAELPYPEDPPPADTGPDLD